MKNENYRAGYSFEKMLKYFFIIIAICILISIAFKYFKERKQDQIPSNMARAEVSTITSEIILRADVIKPFKILLVPGHDTDSGGAVYQNIYERNVAVDIAKEVADKLSKNRKYEVIISRDTEKWNPLLKDYFSTNEKDIIDFKNDHQARDKKLLATGQKKFVPDMANHSNVDKDTAIKLYGMNKWINENDIDLAIHIHFNDSERKNLNTPGYYKGFSIFIPEKQMVNSKTSRQIAQSIYSELSKVLTPEIVGNQKNSIFEDQSLIALGASGTLDKPSLLIEYGYIYEQILRDDETRAENLMKMADRTVAGIINYVENLDQTVQTDKDNK